MNLTRLGTFYGTDKVVQGFTDVYDPRLGPGRLTVRRVLEVGVFFGASLRMWRDYFPSAHVVGLDTFSGVDGWTNVWGDGRRATFPDADRFLREWRRGMHPRIQLLVGNQSDEHSMRDVVRRLQGSPPFDIIVEDGSHLNHDQQTNLVQLLPLLVPGGLYILEDLHCSMQSGFDDPRGSYHTTLRALQRFNKTREMRSRHLSNDQSSAVEAWVQSVEIITTSRHKTTSCITKRYTRSTTSALGGTSSASAGSGAGSGASDPEYAVYTTGCATTGCATTGRATTGRATTTGCVAYT